MFKHETITDNLTTLTRSSSFEKAVKNWTVKRLVALPSREWQSCELCGTRFHEGAIVRHTKPRAEILVGGTCLKTLQRHRFPRNFKFKRTRELTINSLRHHYGPLVHPGNWIKWIVQNAPSKFAQSVADLRSFSLVLESRDLDALIRFHDSKRLFVRRALLGDARSLERTLHIKIPSHITIDQARKIQSKVEAQPPPPVSVLLESYEKRFVRPHIDTDNCWGNTWRGLSSLGRRAITALAVLDERARREQTPICSDDLAARWPFVSSMRAPMFVWNPRIGLGFVGPHAIFDGFKTRVQLWRSHRYGRKLYDLRYWHRVTKCSIEDVQAIEQMAFQGLRNGGE